MTKKQVIAGIVLIIIGLATIIYLNRQSIISSLFRPTQSSITEVEVDQDSIEVVAQNLTTPWSISFLPGGDMLVSERSGQLKRIGQNGQEFTIEGVRETSEGGLLGVALSPNFAESSQIYLYYTTDQGSSLANQIESAKLESDRLSGQKVILADIPAASNHNGGAIKFGPDGKLYITTGDAGKSDLAQDTGSLAGKILRINPDGSTPSDNPFDNLVWSYGHRNPQGIAWDSRGQLWSVEHGPSGANTGRDELNLIEKGANYGWPEITGNEAKEGMKKPILQSGDDETWAPAGMDYYDGKLYFAGLRGQSLYVVNINDDKPTIERYLTKEYGRLRAVTVYHADLYVGTSNRDGRGSPKQDDDQIFSVPLSLL